MPEGNRGDPVAIGPQWKDGGRWNQRVRPNPDAKTPLETLKMFREEIAMRISSTEAKLRGYDPSEIARIKVAEEGNREAAQLIETIHQVFSSIPKPSITLRVALALDDDWIISEERTAELAMEDAEEDWRAVPKWKTEGYQEYFTFSDPPGWRFYLPAFMCHYLEDFPGCGYDAVYWACIRRDKLVALTSEEVAVVERFVTLCHKYESPRIGET